MRVIIGSLDERRNIEEEQERKEHEAGETGQYRESDSDGEDEGECEGDNGQLRREVEQ